MCLKRRNKLVAKGNLLYHRVENKGANLCRRGRRDEAVCTGRGQMCLPRSSWVRAVRRGVRPGPNACAVLCVLLASAAGANEVLVSEDFEKLDLSKLPEGWSVDQGGDLSIVSDPAKGKVLRIFHKGNGCPALVVKLDAAKVRGRTIRATVWGKCPGAYTPLPDQKGWPQLLLMCFDKAGAGNGMIGYVPPNTTDWRQLSTSHAVPADAQTVTVSLRILLVTADAYFDGLQVEVEGAPVPQPQPASPFSGQPAAATPLPPTAAAANAPTKMLEGDGIIFSPVIASAMHSFRKPGATERSFAVVGPGAPVKDLEGKPLETWTRVASGKDVTGIQAMPEGLLLSLPVFVTGNKPEVVIIVGETATGRKLSLANERFDWEDLAGICLRFGAVPVLAVPSQAANNDLRQAMLESARLANCPVMDLTMPGLVARRARQVLDLLEKHVFGRETPETAAKRAGTGPADE